MLDVSDAVFRYEIQAAVQTTTVIDYTDGKDDSVRTP